MHANVRACVLYIYATHYFFGTFDPFLRVGLLMCSFTRAISSR